MAPCRLLSVLSLVSFEKEFWRSRRSLSHSRFAHCLQSDESSHWRERASAFFLSISLPWSHFIPFFRVPAIVPSFLLYGIKYQAAGHNVPLSFWVSFISFFLSSSLFAYASFAKFLQLISTFCIDVRSLFSLSSFDNSFSYLSNVRLKMLFRLIECRTNIYRWIESIQLHEAFWIKVYFSDISLYYTLYILFLKPFVF